MINLLDYYSFLQFLTFSSAQQHAAQHRQLMSHVKCDKILDPHLRIKSGTRTLTKPVSRKLYHTELKALTAGTNTPFSDQPQVITFEYFLMLHEYLIIMQYFHYKFKSAVNLSLFIVIKLNLQQEAAAYTQIIMETNMAVSTHTCTWSGNTRYETVSFIFQCLLKPAAAFL